MDYLVGDVQGCAPALDRLLAAIGFSPSRDHLYVLGDLVNRGPDSLGTLRRLRGFGTSATCLLGNHDWHLLAVAAGVRKLHRTDTLDAILAAPDREEWLAWLRQRRMAVHAHGWLMVHAGVAPQWDLPTTLALAGNLERALQQRPPHDFLARMFGNQPRHWRDVRSDDERLRFTLNALTRIRFVDVEGGLDFDAKDSAADAPAGLVPWFEAPGRQSAGTPIAFGHWASLGLLQRPGLLALDSGCVWGGRLSAARLHDDGCEIVSVPCGESA